MSESIKNDPGLVLDTTETSFHMNSSQAMTAMDIDLDEIRDRVDLLKDTVE